MTKTQPFGLGQVGIKGVGGQSTYDKRTRVELEPSNKENQRKPHSIHISQTLLTGTLPINPYRRKSEKHLTEPHMFGSFIPPSVNKSLPNLQELPSPPVRSSQQQQQRLLAFTMSSSTDAYHMTCLCGAINEPGTLLESTSVPIIAPEICHCNLCRHSTGALGGAFPRLRGSPSQASLDKCAAYDSSAKTRLWHCDTCGCQLFVHSKAADQWYAYSGIIEPVDGSVGVKNVVRVERQEFLGDTGDGGLAPRMLRLGGVGKEREIPCWNQYATSTERRRVTEAEVRDMERLSIEKGKTKPGVNETLQAKCRCEGVDLRIQRADFTKNTYGMTDQIPAHKDKYMADFCDCRSCRLATGVNLIQPWAMMPPGKITVASTGKQVKFGAGAEGSDANEGSTLRHFESSPGVYRSFCGACGATVFYCDSEPESNGVNVAVGILRAEEGCMARRWLDWRWGKVTYKEETLTAELLEAILGEEGRQGLERCESEIV